MINLNTIAMWVSRNTSAILTGVAITSGIAATIECGKASIEAYKLLEKMHYEYEEEPTVKEKFVAVAPLYWKVLALLAIMAGSNVGSLMDSEKKIMALAAICSKYEKELEDSESVIKTMFGEGKLKKVKQEVALKDLHDDIPDETDFYDTGTGTMRFKDTVMGGCWLSDIEFVKHAFNNGQALLTGNGENDIGDILTVEDLLYELKRPRMPIGDELGWQPGEALDLDIQPEDFTKDAMELTSEDLKKTIFLVSYRRPKQLWS